MLRTLLFAASLLVILIFNGNNNANVMASLDGEYMEVFFDDFSGTELDPEVWDTWNNVTHCSPCELQLYMTNNVQVDNGYLTITTKKESVTGGPNNDSFNYTSGWVTAKDKMSHYLGKFEVRAKLPAPTAHGAWPAHWLMPQSDQCWPMGGEIDIMEATASPLQDFYHIVGSYRWGTECTEDKQVLPGASYPSPKETIDFSADFHTFAVEWTETKLTFSVDGDEYETKTSDEVIFPSAPMYFIFDTAVAWFMPPGPNAVYPATHVIDWVRISQKE